MEKKVIKTMKFSRWKSATSFSAKVGGTIGTVTNADGTLTHTVSWDPNIPPVQTQQETTQIIAEQEIDEFVEGW